MSILDYVGAGYSLTPLNGKVPTARNWTTTEYDPLLTEEDFPNNYGVVLKADDLVIDVDPRNFKENINSLKKLTETINHGLNDTFAVKTGSGGYHIYYKKPADLKIKETFPQFPGIEFKTQGRQVVGANCIHPDTNKKYEVFRPIEKLTQAPEVLLNLIKHTSSISIQGTERYTDDLATTERYTKYLQNNAPIAVEGENGDTTTLTVACKGKDFGLSPQATFNLMLSHWNDRCEPEWDYDELLKKVENAYRYGKSAPGCNTAKADFANITIPEEHRIKEEVLLWDEDKSGELKSTFRNTVNFFKVKNLPLYELLGLNEMSKDIIFLKKAPWHGRYHSRTWTDVDAIECRYWLANNQNYATSFDNINQAALAASNQNAFHPIRDYLDSLEWDGVKRLDRWLPNYCGVEDSEYSRLVGSKTIMAAVARIYQPGIKFDQVLILEGKQEIGKSATCKILGGEWSSDVNIDLRSLKDTIENMRGSWIIEFSELEVLKKVDMPRFKAFISAQSDKARLAYRKNAEEFPRQSIFIGTINPEAVGYLDDPTGNRRFWPVWVNEVKFSALEEDRDQLFAEAKHRFFNGEKIFVEDLELRKLLAVEQEKRQIEDPWVAAIENYVEKIHKDTDEIDFTTAEIAFSALNIPLRNLKKGGSEARRISNILKDLGFKAIITKVEGKSTRVWRYPIYEF